MSQHSTPTDDASVTMKPVGLWRKINALGAPAREAIQALDETEKVSYYKHLSKFEDELHNFASIQSDEIDAIGCWNAIKGKLDELGEGAEAIEKAKLLLTDLKHYPELVEPFKGNAGLVEAWKSLFSKQAWRTNTDHLAVVSRYADDGMEFLEEGSDIIVKQADGLKIGKFDIDDPYNPGLMKVKAEVSHRHFDPDKAGGPISKKSWQNATIDQQGIDDVTTHLARFGPNPDNAMMIQRLQDVKDGNIPITDYDKRFYTHELEEYARYKNLGIADGANPGDVWDHAHAASLEVFSINEGLNPNIPVTPLYHP